MKSFANCGTLAAILLSLCGTVSIAQDEVVRIAKTMTVSADHEGQTRQFFGHVVAKETVDLAFQVDGQIVEFPVIEGGTVAQGETIARVDVEPYELALDQAQVQYDQAVRTYERLKKLQGGAVSQVSVDDADTQLQITSIALRDAQRSLRNTTLVSPFDGLVASRNVAKFATVAAGTPVVRLHDMSDLRIEIDVPEVLFQHAGKEEDIKLMAQFPSGTTQYELAVREFKAETADIGQTYQITLGMAPPEDLLVLPGASVTVYATIPTADQAPVIPSSAVITDAAGNPAVMVFTAQEGDIGTVQNVPVTITPGARGEVIVTSGLTEGQEIVASGANQLADGERVRRFTGFAR
ncbi:efflux RND transporter periplasmic adaptor subunit [Neptunicoccus sediminis]|uniref:efflux RND transporter periplasmic adaptor subunit n=1 Tax=Neptunicoccus sediminis TaxID=1892596 RepID=UPI0008462735|nr:efflux RND transporter periplasmic adaptor subunit [Neptunicoccus sediminis]